MRMTKLSILLLLIAVNSFSALQIREGRIEPEFAKPGESITVFIEATHDYNKPVSLVGVISENQTWEANQDYLFWYSGGANKEALPPPVPQYNFSTTEMNQHLEWWEYSFTFIVPANFEEGKTYYLIVKGSQENTPFVSTIKAEDIEIIPMEVASNKGVVYNTAYLGEKKSTAKFVMVAGPPPANLEASPSNGIGNIYVYNKSLIKVALSTNNVPDAKIYYTLDGTTPTNGSTLYTDSVLIQGDDTLKAIAIVPGLANSIGEWYYDQQLPSAKLNATPANETIYSYDTPTLNVLLSTNFGGNIVWQLINSDDFSAITPWDTVMDSSYTVQIAGDVIISAFTLGENYSSVDSMWEYDCELPVLEIVADPSDKTFKMNLNVKLSAEYNNTDVDAEIKYIVSTDGKVYQPSEIKNQGALYDPQVGIDINSSVVIYAIATNSNYADGYNSFSYVLDLEEVTIDVDPSEEPDYKIGDKLDTIVITSNADSIKWVMSDMIMDSLSTLNSGTVYNFVSGAFPTISISDPDTVYLSVVGFGHGFESGYKTFKYVKQTLPDIEANFFSSDGYKFSLPHSELTLSVPNPDNKYENVKIFFFIDSSSFGALPDSTDSLYDNGIKLEKTIYVKAIAYADNAKKSNVFEGYYILAAGVVNAVYVDEDGNGEIDASKIDLSMELEHLPDSVEFVSPFNPNEKRIVTSNSIEFDGAMDKLSVTLETPFSYNHEDGTTGFDNAELGKIYSKFYVEAPFVISDSVAPLIQKGYYRPGRIIQTEESVERACDTLILTFSEEINVDNLQNREVNLADVLNYKTMKSYDFDLNLIEKLNSVCRFEVIRYNGDVTYPESGDSIRIDCRSNISDLKGTIQTVSDNRYGYLKVFALPYLLKVKATTPVNPLENSIPEAVKFGNIDKDKGVLIIADFHMVLPVQEKLNAEIFIYDQVGTLVASNNEISSSENISIDIEKNNSNNRTRVIIVWDGKNSKGRKVGTGTYVADIKITDPNGESVPFIIPIGIKE